MPTIVQRTGKGPPMDPSVTLDRIRKAIKAYRDSNESLNSEGCNDALMECLDASTDLVEWIDKGGFLPQVERDPPLVPLSCTVPACDQPVLTGYLHCPLHE